MGEEGIVRGTGMAKEGEGESEGKGDRGNGGREEG